MRPPEISSRYLVPFDGKFKVAGAPTRVPKRQRPSKEEAKARLAELVEELGELQRALYADDRFSVLLVFQAMDAAGKDGTIRALLTGVNPVGVQVFSFKQPSAEELDHDFLWRIHSRAPERGRIGVFNRSHYEDVVVVRVHEDILEAQKLPPTVDRKRIWKDRYESIRAFEEHLARNGTLILKFWLNVSRETQRERLLQRIEDPEANWKVSPTDIAERRYWNEYMKAYEEALRETSRPHAPWIAVPADDKPVMRVIVAEIVVDALKQLKLGFPKPSAEQVAELAELRARLRAEEEG